jgi:hypothetical protein
MYLFKTPVELLCLIVVMIPLLDRTLTFYDMWSERMFARQFYLEMI